MAIKRFWIELKILDLNEIKYPEINLSDGDKIIHTEERQGMLCLYILRDIKPE